MRLMLQFGVDLSELDVIWIYKQHNNAKMSNTPTA